MSLFQCSSKKPNLPEVGGWVGELQLFAPTSPPSRSLSSLWLSAAVIYLFMYVVKKVCVGGGGGSPRTRRTCSQRTGSGVMCFRINWKRQTLELLQGEKRPPARALYTLHLKSLHSTEYLAHSDPKSLLASSNSLLRPSAREEGGGGKVGKCLVNCTSLNLPKAVVTKLKGDTTVLT